MDLLSKRSIMKQIRLSCGMSFFLSFILLFSSFPVVAIADVLSASDFEKICIMRSEQEAYICLDASLSNLGYVIDEVAVFDQDVLSPIHLLKQHKDNNCMFALRDEVLH